METWDNYFANASQAVEHTVAQDGSFAFIFDRPMLQYWKGTVTYYNNRPFVERGAIDLAPLA
jgi:hypothetical protein